MRFFHLVVSLAIGVFNPTGGRMVAEIIEGVFLFIGTICAAFIVSLAVKILIRRNEWADLQDTRECIKRGARPDGVRIVRGGLAYDEKSHKWISGGPKPSNHLFDRVRK